MTGNRGKQVALNRRRFLETSAASVTLLAMQPMRAGAAVAHPPAREFGDPLREFGYGDVALGEGPHRRQREQTHQILMGLNDDGLMRPFRLAAGLPAPGLDLGGWYSSDRFLAETFGQWLSALGRYHLATGDAAAKAKAAGLFDKFMATLTPQSRLFAVNGNPLYFHDKLVLGLADSVSTVGAAKAADGLVRFADFSQDIFARKHSRAGWAAPDNIDGATSLSGYNFAETYLLAWQRSGDDRYLTLARQDMDDAFIDALAEGRNVLARKHGYAHVNSLCGSAKAYLALGDAKYLRAAVNGLRFAEAQRFATGGYAPGEGFLPKPASEFVHPDTGEKIAVPARGGVGDSVLMDRHHFETGCGSYAHVKLTRALLRITRDPRYGDSMERVLYNCALGALPLNRFGKAFYQSSYARYATKQYFDGYGHVMEDAWPCCSGSLAQLAVDYHVSAYFRDDQGVFVNLYLPSTLKWRAGDVDVALTQAGDYPLTDSMRLTVNAARPVRFALRLRIPAWAVDPTITVNGRATGRAVKPGSFAEISRRWTDGDRVEIVLPRRLAVEAADAGHPDLVALTCGPMVLFAIGHDLPAMTRATLLAARQSGPGSPEWRSGDIRFLPWWVIRHEVYTTYHEVG